MTVSPWTDTAKMISNAIFGDPRMRAESEKMDLERKKADIAERQYLLEEALNPVKIRQAEAEAARNAAQTGVYNIERDRGALELDALRRFGNGSASRQDFTQELPGQSNGGIPPISMDELDAPVPRVDIQKPGTPDDFAAMLSGGGPSVSPERSFSDVLSDAMSTTPDMPEQMPALPRPDYFGEARLLVQSGRLDPDKMGPYILSREAMDQAGGAASPQDRIRLLSTGAGNPFSQDETLAQALGGQRSQEQLATMAEEQGRTADIQNYRYGLDNPDFAAMLASKNDGPSFSVTNPDGTTVTYGKNGGGKLTEQQSKVALNASVMAPGIAALAAAYNGRKASSLSSLLTKSFFGDDPAITDMAQRAGLINEDDQMINAAINGVMNFLYLQTGAARTPGEDKRGYVELTPLASDTPDVLAFKKAQLEQKARSIIRTAPSKEIQDELLNAVQGVWTSKIPVENTSQTPPGGAGVQNAEPRISSDEEFEALPSGTFFYGPDGQKRRKP